MIHISNLGKEELSSLLDINNKEIASLREKQLSISVEIWHLKIENEKIDRALRALENLPMNRYQDRRR